MWSLPDSPPAPAHRFSDADEAAFFQEAASAYRPPATEDAGERIARLRLIRSRRVGTATYLRLMAEHRSAADALRALPEIARAAGVESYTTCPEPVALAEIKAAKRAGARMICLGDADYPTSLAESGDAPPILWAKGRADLLARPMLALVGTRNASAMGARMARRLAADLGDAGHVIVSGLARGIDALAHQASLETGTIAVLAGGLDCIYPAENTDLAAQIAQKGLLLSEMPFGLHPQARHFPRRNRIVAGLARAVIVVEAATRSGSLITARIALDQGREVMAVPGHPMDARAGGGNQLIRDGALLVRDAADVIAACGQDDAVPRQSSRPVARDKAVPLAPPPPHPDGGLEGAILALLGTAPLAEDQLIRDLGQPPRAVAQALAILELAGRIQRGGGGLLTRL